ncbi:MAG: M20/M25/M40 family metallo-hydrolase [Armatimonadetes bacterium]|nr:M20/M25/M40 family metallo-hydrolase [Armatimonadota bacterium]
MWKLPWRRGAANDRLESALKAHVQALAGDIGERNVFHPHALQAAAAYIRGHWERLGMPVGLQAFEVDDLPVQNLETEVAGSSGEVFLLGAHYDSVMGSPGANDNGSGVAALLELSRIFKGKKLRRTVRFVAFVNEEPPFFCTEHMGSQVYASAARARGDRIYGMISLETVGYFSEEPNSQQYPPGLTTMFPDRGNFLAVVGDMNSQRLVGEIHQALLASRAIPTEALATFSNVPGVSWSDHASFWKEGYPAVMLTDTAPFRYPHYHTAEDLPSQVNYAGLTAVTRGVQAVVEAICG